jgi:thioredoxin 1
MSNLWKTAIVVGLMVTVGAVLAMKNNAGPKLQAAPPAVPTAQAAGERSAAQKLPRLVDIGANKCIPCKAMKPILDELAIRYAGTFDVVFIDVWENPAKAKEYGVEIIPTQVFYDAAGRELFRHQGFYGKEDILAKWKELGVDPMVAGK